MTGHRKSLMPGYLPGYRRDGATYSLWGFNLRYKSDSSSRGPREGQPVLVGQGMRGDRAQVVFASPAEISEFIRKECSNK